MRKPRKPLLLLRLGFLIISSSVKAEQCNLTSSCTDTHQACFVLKYCDDDFQGCTDTVDGAHNTINYIPFFSTTDLANNSKFGSCFDLQPVGAACDSNNLGCKDTWCNKKSVCEAHCEKESNCRPGTSCITSIDYCNNPGDCSASNDRSTMYSYSKGDNGTCLTVNDIGQNCDESEFSCAAGLICDQGTCTAICRSDDDCDGDEICINDTQWCDRHGNCIGDDSDPTKQVIHYTPGSNGICFKNQTDNNICDEYTLGCTSLKCDSGVCATPCYESKDCPPEYLCVSGMEYCDEIYKNCTSDRPPDWDYTADDNFGTLLYKFATASDPGVCLEYSPYFCSDTIVCEDGHCNPKNSCQATCDSGTCEVKTQECFETLEFCNVKYENCQSDTIPTPLFESIIYTEGMVGLCYESLPSEAPNCNHYTACHDGLCLMDDASGIGVCDDPYLCDSGDVTCPDARVCYEITYCNDMFEDCIDIESDESKTLNYINMTLDLTVSPVIEGRCLEPVDSNESCDDLDYGCKNANDWCSTEGKCTVLCKEDKDCAIDEQCLNNIEWCNPIYKDCKDTRSVYWAGTIMYTKFTGTLGHGYCVKATNGSVDSQLCDDELTCYSGFCNVNQDCQNPCVSDDDCFINEKCVSDIMYCNEDFSSCDIEEKPELKPENVNLQYEFSNPGLCYPIGSVVDGDVTCNDRTICDGITNCRDGFCEKTCTAGDPTAACGGDEICLEKIEFCDELYENCLEYKPVSWDGSIKYTPATGSGICTNITPSDGDCDYSNACATYLCDNNNECLKQCPDGKCELGYSCYTDIKYCDHNYEDCKALPDTTHENIKYENDGSGSGICYESVADTEDCNGYVTCADGLCDKTGVCSSTCEKDSDCNNTTKTQQCLTSVYYCDAMYTSCSSTIPNTNIIYDFDESIGVGICYEVQTNPKDICTNTLTCSSGICENGSCRAECNIDARMNCPSDQLCITDVEFCDDDYTNCQSTSDSSLTTIIHHMESTENGICYPSGDEGDPCSAYSEACLSGFCDKNRLCENRCDADHPCDGTDICVAEVLYCDENYQNCSTSAPSDGLYTILASESGIGHCDTGLPDGSSCDATTDICNSGHCNTSGKCQSKCVDDSDCSGGICYSELLLCNNIFGDCSETYPTTSPPETIKYKYDGLSGLCYDVVGDGYSCDIIDTCASGFCGPDKTCKQACADNTECPIDEICVEQIKYCNDTFDTCSDAYPPAGTPLNNLLYTLGGPGTCYPISKDDTCDATTSICDAARCEAGKCSAVCDATTKCLDTEQCVGKVEYCDANFEHCDETMPVDWDGTIVTTEDTVGTCYPIAEDGNPCNSNIVCLSGRCDKDGQCQVGCNDDSECGLDEQCLSSVLYCNAVYAECTAEEPALIETIKYEKNGPGYCYPAIPTDKPCDATLACSDGFCSSAGVCEKTCISDEECPIDNHCLTTVEYCDDLFNDCQEFKDDDHKQIVYNKSDAGSPGLCYPENPIDSTCNEKETCSSGFCLNNKCLNHCGVGFECDAGQKCVEDVTYCNDMYEECDPDLADHTGKSILFLFGEEGTCYVAKNNGDKCTDKTDSGCESGYCNADRLCENPCSPEKPCDLDHVCVSSLEYCTADFSSCTAMRPTDGVIDGINYVFGSEGSCYLLNDEGMTCDETTNSCDSGYCDSGMKCANHCSSEHSCPNSGLSCVESVLYCDINYESCTTTKPSGTDYTLKFNIGDDGKCYDNAEIGEGCSETVVCVEGFCGRDETCIDVCSPTQICSPGKECIEKLEYCNGAFEDCSETMFIGYATIKATEGVDGACFPIVGIGESCDETVVCEGGYCNKGKCDGRHCSYDNECATGEQCLTDVWYCDDYYSYCSTVYTGDIKSLVFEHVENADGMGSCHGAVVDGESCNSTNRTCWSGYCNVDKICEDHCYQSDECDDGKKCVSKMLQCDENFALCEELPLESESVEPTAEHRETIVYEFAGVGTCYLSAELGEPCGDVYVCGSGFCGPDQYCVEHEREHEKDSAIGRFNLIIIYNAIISLFIIGLSF